jgi:hypothetical protein
VGLAGVSLLAAKANVTKDSGIINLSGNTSIGDFIKAAETGRFWEREMEK